MTAFEISAIKQLLAVCQRIHTEWMVLGLDDELLSELSDAQSDVEDLLVFQ